MTDSALHPALFRQSAVAEDTTRLNDALVDLMTGLPDWWNVGAEATREARRQGRGPFLPAIKSPRARTIFIQGRDGNEIPLRLIAPAQPRGVYLHIHGGASVLAGNRLVGELSDVWNVARHADQADVRPVEIFFSLRNLVCGLARITEAGQFRAVRYRLRDQFLRLSRRAGRQRLIDELIVDSLIGA